MKVHSPVEHRHVSRANLAGLSCGVSQQVTSPDSWGLAVLLGAEGLGGALIKQRRDL